MRTKAWLSGIFVALALGLAPMGATLAQTTTSKNVLNFEVISVDGNKVVVRDQNGAREITVPADFKFTVDGKKLSVSELKPGMKGTATVTTTTTMTPVTVTEMRDADVVRASDVSVTIKTASGEYRKFGQGELDKRGIQIVKDGKVVRTADLKRGDKLTATIVTAGPAVALTAKEVDATLADATPAPAATPMASSTSASPPAAAPAMAPAATPAPAAAPAMAPAAAPPAAPAPAAAAPAPAADTGMSLTWWVIIAIVIALLVFFFRRKQTPPAP